MDSNATMRRVLMFPKTVFGRLRNSRSAPSREKPKKRGSKGAVIGRIMMVLLCLAICAIPPLFINNAMGYIPLIAVAGILLISFAYLLVLRKSFHFSEASMASTCDRGSSIEFVVEMGNSSPLVFPRVEIFIYISDLFDDDEVVIPSSLALMPFEERDFRFDASFEHIGTYSAGVRKIVISDLLGLFSHTIQNDERHPVDVLPRVFDVDSLDISEENSKDSMASLKSVASDDMDYAGVRDYIWGDSMKSVHWKLSSRMPEGDYLTRLFESYSNPGIDIIVDTTAPNYDSEDLMHVYDGVVESALSLNRFSAKNGIESGITFLDRDDERCTMHIEGAKEFDRLIERLPKIKSSGEDATLDLIRRESARRDANENIAICSANITPMLIEALLGLRANRRTPFLFAVMPPGLDDAKVAECKGLLKRLDATKVPYFIIDSARDLEGVELS